MDDHERKEAGRKAESMALAHLQRAGLELITRNYRCRTGEIDLVMREGATLVLIEVRYRASSRYGGAAASVTWRKQRRIANAARHLLLTHTQLRAYPARFDVVAVSPAPAGITWIRRAFTL